MTVYTESAESALEALAEYGTAATLNRYTPTVNVTTEAVTKGTATSIFGSYAIELPMNGRRFINGTLVSSTSVVLFAAASGATFDPRAGDEIVWGTVTYQIKAIEKLAPDGTPIAYTLEVIAL